MAAQGQDRLGGRAADRDALVLGGAVGDGRERRREGGVELGQAGGEEFDQGVVGRGGGGGLGRGRRGRLAVEGVGGVGPVGGVDRVVDGHLGDRQRAGRQEGVGAGRLDGFERPGVPVEDHVGRRHGPILERFDAEPTLVRESHGELSLGLRREEGHHPGAQTVRRGGVGPVGAGLAVRTPPATRRNRPPMPVGG